MNKLTNRAIENNEFLAEFLLNLGNADWTQLVVDEMLFSHDKNTNMSITTIKDDERTNVVDVNFGFENMKINDIGTLIDFALGFPIVISNV